MTVDRRGFGGQTSVGRIERVLVCAPGECGWARVEPDASWASLGYLRPPDAVVAGRQHAELVDCLRRSAIEVETASARTGLSADAVYMHDASLITDGGAILLRMGKENREGEPDFHGDTYRALGVPLLGRIQAPGTAEAGDMVWLDAGTLLVGRGTRTNDDGIRQLAEILGSLDVRVIAAPLPWGRGPDACLHLMSLLSMLDERRVLVDIQWLAVETVELLRERGFELIEIEESERDTLACNVLALGDGRLMTFAGNPVTTARLRDYGFAVEEIDGSEIGVLGSGGCTCLTRPLLRRSAEGQSGMGSSS